MCVVVRFCCWQKKLSSLRTEMLRRRGREFWSASRLLSQWWAARLSYRSSARYHILILLFGAKLQCVNVFTLRFHFLPIGLFSSILKSSSPKDYQINFRTCCENAVCFAILYCIDMQVPLYHCHNALSVQNQSGGATYWPECIPCRKSVKSLNRKLVLVDCFCPFFPFS